MLQDVNNMAYKEFAKKVVKSGIKIAENYRGDQFIGAFGKTYYVRFDAFNGKVQDCCKMTPDEWKQSIEDFRDD